MTLEGSEIPCGDPVHPWHVVREAAGDPEAACQGGSGYKVVFPDSLKDDCATDPVGDRCYPEPGSKLEIMYLSQEGNSARCF